MWHTHPFNGPLQGLPRSVGTRKVKPIWILLKQETVSGSGISWAICKCAPRSRQITTPAPHHSDFYRPDALPAAQPTASKHWRDSNSPPLLLYYSVPVRAAQYCDNRVCLSVCLSVRDHISGTPRPIFANFLCLLPMAVARSSSGGLAIRYVLPVCGWRHICS